MARRSRKLREAAPTITLILALVVGGIALWQAWGIVSHLRDEARTNSAIYGSIISALTDDISDQTGILLNLAERIRGTGIQLIVTDPRGRISACSNLALAPDPCAENELGDPRIADYVVELDRANPPVVTANGSQIHYGITAVARRLTWLTVFQLSVLSVAVLAGAWGYRNAAHMHRDRLWVAMARESAHQLGTPLMSAAAWIERLRDPEPDAPKIARFLRADLDRLERVASRFERIGRPKKPERVALGSLAARVVNYFEPRLPKHANKVNITVKAPTTGPMVSGDVVLLEWAIEALVRNSIDALSGRGGNIVVTVQRTGDKVEVRVQDDGPGVGIEVRGNLFEPGITTKSGGWGIGLALAHRIVEDVHDGQLRFDAIENGALFVASFPVDAE